MRQMLWQVATVVGAVLCLYGAVFCCLRAMPKWVFVARDGTVTVRSVAMLGSGPVNTVVDGAFAPMIAAELAVRRAFLAP